MFQYDINCIGLKVWSWMGLMQVNHHPGSLVKKLPFRPGTFQFLVTKMNHDHLQFPPGKILRPAF